MEMEGVFGLLGLFGAVLLYFWIDRSLKGKPMPSLHISTAEEKAAAEAHLAEQQELWRLPSDSTIHYQYYEHFFHMPFDSDFVPKEYVDYFRREHEELIKHKPAEIKRLMRDEVKYQDNNMTAWNNFCFAFGGERMIKDRKGKPSIIDTGLGFNPDNDPHPIDAAIRKTWWWYWKRTHYPELIRKYNETGKFIPGWKWRPLDEIPDYHEN